MSIAKSIYLALVIGYTFISGCQIGYCQTWYFDQLYNPNSTWAIGMGILGEENGYSGVAITDVIPYGSNNIAFYKLDEEGELLYWNNYGNSNRNYFPGWEGNLKKCKDSCYFIFGSSSDASSKLGLFMIFKPDGDTLLTRTYESLDSYAYVGRVGCETFDGGFALIGEKYVGSGYSDFLMIKTDSIGNELWRSQFGTDRDVVATSIFQSIDTGFVIGGLSVLWHSIYSDPIVFKTDSVGNVEWENNLGGPLLDDEAKVCDSGDGNIMVLTAIADSMLTPNTVAYNRINLAKLSLDNTLIWSYKFGSSKVENLISSIKRQDNGNYITCGHVAMEEMGINPAGWIMEFGPEGDSLWYREYYHWSNDGHNYFNGISSASDNGFIAVGQAWEDDPNDTQQMWVLKVDSVGCEIPGCWVGLEEEIQENTNCSIIHVYPNPASSTIYFRLSSMHDNGYTEIEIWDIFGRLVDQVYIPKGQKIVQSNVNTYPEGVYVVILRGNNEVIARRKFVISK